NDCLITEKCAAFGVRDFSSVEKEQGVGIAGVDVQRASLVRMPEHLHDAGKIVMAKATAEAGVSLRKHLGGLKAFGFADDDVANVSSDHRGRAAAIDIVVTAGLKSLHESPLAAVTQSNDRQSSVFHIGADQPCDVECPHFAHVG